MTWQGNRFKNKKDRKTNQGDIYQRQKKIERPYTVIDSKIKRIEKHHKEIGRKTFDGEILQGNRYENRKDW